MSVFVLYFTVLYVCLRRSLVAVYRVCVFLSVRLSIQLIGYSSFRS